MKSLTAVCRAGMIAGILFGLTHAAHGSVLVSGFEELGLDAASYRNGSDLAGGFYGTLVHYRNSYNTNWFSWSGFAISSISNTVTAGYGNQYAVWTPGTGANGSATYAVAYDDAWDEQDVVRFPFPVCVKGFYVNNTTYAALAMRDGSFVAKKFGGTSGNDPDWFKLTVTGKDAAGSVLGTQDFYLADYRFTNNANDYIVGNWTWVDLTALGSAVKTLHFALSSSDNDPVWGMNTPAYFAMDDIAYIPKPAKLVADIEETLLSPADHWNGSDLAGGFYSASAHFRNAYNTNWFSWSGFAYSSVSNTVTPGYGNQYAVWTPGTGANGSATYAVAYDDAWDEQDVVTLAFPALVNGFYVNNTTYAALTMRDGGYIAKRFGGASGNDPDWFKLTVTGKDRTGAVLGTKDFYLADYRFANNANDYIIGAWGWVDLTALGPTVKTLHFALSSSDNDPIYGMNTPAYFAMDRLSYVHTFSAAMNDSNLYDPPVPGFVGPDGAGVTDGGNNYLNPAFAGWADTVVNYSPTPNVGPDWRISTNALGPTAGSEMAVVSLGDLSLPEISGGVPPGSITLRMETPICDRDGPDFAVFENAFAWNTNFVFGEVGYVEVSSDGTHFTRFPSVCLNASPIGAFEGLDPRLYGGLCGKHANWAGASWGTPFDLSDLACHAAVQSGQLSLTNISYVRVVDIPGNGAFQDTFTPPHNIYDAWQTIVSGGVDLDAVGVLNSARHARVRTATVGPGTITPYGMPDGAVAVPHGSNMTFAVAAAPGYHLIDVRVNGASLGPIPSYTFTNVWADQRITARFGSRLIVRSAYGAGAPPFGTNYGFGTFSAAVTGSPFEAGATQYVCRGWTGQGSVAATGNATGCTFNLTNDSTLAWEWNTNYWLAVQAVGPGRVDRMDAWQPQGDSVTATATPDPYYEFKGWSGDTQGDTNNATMALGMDRPRTIAAHFWTDVASNNVPLAWLTAHGLTNGLPDDLVVSDLDHDGLFAWQEFYAGTDPRNPTSLFAIVAIGTLNGSNYVAWLGGTNGSTRPFAVLGSRNLRSGWSLLDGHVVRSATGTNFWWDDGASNRFYRIQVNTGD